MRYAFPIYVGILRLAYRTDILSIRIVRRFLDRLANIINRNSMFTLAFFAN